MQDNLKRGENNATGIPTEWICFASENEKLKSVAACVYSANRAITLAQDRAAQAGLSCQQLERSIARLVAERQDLQEQLEGVEWERKRGERRREEYGNKMERHRQRVSSAEQDSEAHRELAELQHKKQRLEDSSKANPL